MSDIVGTFEIDILKIVIALQPNAHGTTILKRLEDVYQRPVSIGAVYTALGRLTRRGFLEYFDGPPTPERGGRRKRFYNVTISGSTVLDRFEVRQQAIKMMPELKPI